MSKYFKKSLFMLCILFIINFTACTTETASEVESFCREYKIKLYNITDYNAFDKTQIFQETDKIDNEFKDYFTQSGLSLFKGLRLSTKYKLAAYNQKYNMRLVKLELTKDYENEKDNMAGYNYIASIKISSLGKEDKTVFDKGYFNMIKKNGKWKLIVDKIDSSFLDN